MLILTRQVPTTMLGKDAFQEVDITGITQNITKHNYLVDNPLDIVNIVTEAIFIATSGRPGPIHIDLPKDVMSQEHPRQFEIPKKNPFKTAFNTICSQDLENIIEILNTAKQPIFLIGHGIKLSNAEILAKKFIEKLNIPTVSTILSKGIIEDNHPNHLGMIGMHGFYHTNKAVHEADIIINIGSRFDDKIVGFI